MSVVSCQLLSESTKRASKAGHRPNCQLLSESTANCQLPTANCQLPTVNCQLSTVN
ncbi:MULTISPECIES: hypothetical protein [unclassified Microcoleus]|uniref:hypothetical protein n=1 Tax=unclassified Microcoleus TaxID=2642155 RepID=UPI001E125671|nr:MULTISPECIES: hypothetical protein [unclassified Microcoleus]MCC3447092.1 hypothetical protein [Microcoleus sp. PH2017_09_SFU_O_A]MCC3568949.1 hypothetical protein [Microcoleus sp. PH2017_31_RDM_U_A]MCC3626312.1 hypothetical protein [Microcoleus sp. PH2017_36_ELK_O_B]